MSNLLFERFLFVTKALNTKLGIVPVLYGSLGLEILTGISTFPEDIDVLVPLRFLQERWEELKNQIEQQGYTLIDLREHEFCNSEHRIAFSHIEDLEGFAGIKVSDIEERINGTIKYRLLNLHQYYTVYSKSIRDGYRINIRNKKDREKIELIKGLMK